MNTRPVAAAALCLLTAAAHAQATRPGGALSNPKANFSMPLQQPPALTRAQVEEKLRNVPVFTITDLKGSPMLATPPGAKKPVTNVFINPRGAQSFVDGLKKARPEMAGKVRVTTVSLVDIYRLALQPNAPFLCQFVPDPQEVAAARPLMPAGQALSVPLFVGRSGDKNSLLTIKHENQEIVPFYFSKADLDAVLAKFSAKGLPKGMSVQVMDLQAVLGSLTTSPDKGVARVLLIPARSAAEYVQAQAKAAGKP